MDEREFWLEMRRGLLMIAKKTDDYGIRDGVLQMAKAIEKRYLPDLDKRAVENK